MRIIEIKVFKIDEHPNKEMCFEWIRANLHDLNSHSVDDIIESINSLSEKIGGTSDYVICQEPSRGECITFKDYSHECLHMLDVDACPLTGTYWDIELIEGLKSGNTERVLELLHGDTEYQYSDEGLLDLCQASEYEFTEDGKLVS